MGTDQKVAVVTGGSQGIGAGVVDAYRTLGYGVVATSRTIEPSPDPGVVTVQGDIASADTAERVIDAALRRFGRVDTLVNNAGVFVVKPFTDYTIDDFDLLIGVNLAGFFHITQRALRDMLSRESGHIVNLTATLVDSPNSKIPAALASLTKGGLSSATKSLAIEYALRGVRVNAVSPGNIKTPLHPVETREALAALHPIGRMGEISEVVEAIVYLETAAFVTGEILHVDGGQSAGH
jgi:NAD(P)-dependent dehydrogenase (short-subunit alcohol dehydrogenase family)